VIKNVIFAVLQFTLFFVLFGIGSCNPHPKLRQTVASGADGTRIFVWDGVVLMLLLFLVIVLVQAIRKHVRSSTPWTVLAMAVATAIGFPLKFGLLTVQTVLINRQ
jgi:hypothetical protein